jgi:hypothetical protein
MSLTHSIVDALFIVLCVTCFGTIIWYNITEISKVRKRLKAHERDRTAECKR